MTGAAGPTESVEIVAAHSRPDAADHVAQAHLAEWGDLYPDLAPAVVIDELRADLGHAHSPEFRRSWYATIGGEVVGSVALRGSGEVDPADEDRFPGPWLANLWVEPMHRGHGFASALLDHAADAARGMDIGRLRLVTTDAVPIYLRRGWVIEDDITIGGRPAIVMIGTLEP